MRIREPFTKNAMKPSNKFGETDDTAFFFVCVSRQAEE
jgi:hypothetical protein